jgi:hypothetical protein
VPSIRKQIAGLYAKTEAKSVSDVVNQIEKEKVFYMKLVTNQRFYFSFISYSQLNSHYQLHMQSDLVYPEDNCM